MHQKGADAGAQYVTTGEVSDFNSLMVSGTTGAISGGTLPTILKSGGNVVLKNFIAETAINVVDSGSKQLVSTGNINAHKIVSDVTIATVTGKMVVSNKSVNTLQKKYESASRRVDSPKANAADKTLSKIGKKEYGQKLNAAVAKQTATRASAPKLVENVGQYLYDTYVSPVLNSVANYFTK